MYRDAEMMRFEIAAEHEADFKAQMDKVATVYHLLPLPSLYHGCSDMNAIDVMMMIGNS